MSRVTGSKKPAAPKPAEGAGNGGRPITGASIRDRLATFRAQLGVTIADTSQAIAEGQPRQKAVFGDRILQGSELTKAKSALVDMQKALKALKPVAGDRAPATSVVRAPGSRPGGGFRAMYGMALRDDLFRFRTDVGVTLRELEAGITSGKLKGDDKKEAQAAIKHLKQAVKDLTPGPR